MKTWFLAVLAAFWVLATPAWAHWADLAVADITLGEAGVDIVLTIPTGLVAAFDDDHDGQLSKAEIEKHADALAERLGKDLVVTAAGQTLSPKVAPSGLPPPSAGLGKDPHSTLALSYNFAGASQPLAVHYGLFLDGVSTARCLATVAAPEGVESVVFTPTNPTYATDNRGWPTRLGSYVVLGIEHILMGFDHVLFLVSLLVLATTLRSLLVIVTGFTVAHSLTLALAAFGYVALPPRLVECAIALTIVYVALENFWRTDMRGRGLMTFAFGLIHGLGFASVLRELAIPTGALALSLVGFNLGVEFGQALIVVVVFGIFKLMGDRPWATRLRLGLSGGVAAMGAIWFIERAFELGPILPFLPGGS